MPYLVTLDLLPPSLSTEDLKRLLSVFLGILRAEVLTDRNGQSLGIAIIEVTDNNCLDLLIRALDELDIGGNPIRASRLEVSEELVG